MIEDDIARDVAILRESCCKRYEECPLCPFYREQICIAFELIDCMESL